jgi:hypothetical protein
MYLHFKLHRLQVGEDGIFQSEFAINLSAFAVLKVHGRPVCSTDMGHFKHDFFDGLSCTVDK